MKIVKNGGRVVKKLSIKILAFCLSVLMVFSFAACDKADELFGGGGNSSASPVGGVEISEAEKLKNDTIVDGELTIHFLELGNKYTGDCIYIKAGDVDILIDAGSKVSSVDTINSYISGYVTDNKLEYVIVTHAHEDHYAGFATTEKKTSLFDLYECETIIDFAQVTSGKADTAMYKNYVRERDDEIKAGATHYTAAEFVEMGGVVELAEGMTLTILDSYFYYNRSSDENNHSVCTLLTHGENNYLFTGDLELEGEEKLVEMNELPTVKVFKAGHHGSKTSSNEVLLEVIKPQIVCVCCCAGSPQYTDTDENQFPTQQFINRIAPYTDKVYVTTLCVDYKNDKYESMNGNIVIRSDNGGVTVVCSESTKVLKEFKWFKEHRILPKAWGGN